MDTSKIGTVLGVLGFGLSCVNLWRSIQASKETRSLAFAQKKQEALALVLEGEVATMAARRQLWEIRDDAHEVGVTEIVESADAFIQDLDRSLVRLAEVRRELEARLAAEMGHEDHVRLIETTMAKIRQITDPKKISEEVAVFVDPARRHIAQRKKLKENGQGVAPPRSTQG